MRYYLGIDPSLRAVGVSVGKYRRGNFKPLAHLLIQSKAFGPQRLADIYIGVNDFIAEHEANLGNIALAVMEGYAYNRFQGGRMFELGEAGGVIKLCLHHRGIDLATVTTQQLKKWATGNGGVKAKDKAKAMAAAMVGRFGSSTGNDNTDDSCFLSEMAAGADPRNRAFRLSKERREAIENVKFSRVNVRR